MNLNSEHLREKLRHISKDILRREDFHEKLAPAITEYSDLLARVVKIDNNDELNRKHVQSEFGEAIGTFWAAQCIKEIFRTQRFVRGLYLAIKEKLHQKSGPVHVLYAGTGPFATLALPIMMNFSPEEVQFTLLEINPQTFDVLQNVLDVFNIGAYVAKCEIADATVYQVENTAIDIVLSETMSRALIKEPQVAIMLNFASQLPSSTIFLPEEISVSLCSRKRSEAPTLIKNLMVFNASLMYKLIEDTTRSEWRFEEVAVETAIEEDEHLYFSTEIKVYNDNFLGLNDCSLNLLEKIKTDKLNLKYLRFKYSLKEMPGFKVY